MEALKLDRKVYQEGLDQIEQAVANDQAYLDQFAFEFPDGLNTANTLEICRVVQDSSLESKIHLTKICIAGKNVSATCPNGDKMSFCLSNPNDSIEGFELFKKEPLALWALADTVYGFILKKSVRLSKTVQAESQEATVKA